MQTTIIPRTAVSGTTAITSVWFAHGGGPLSLQLITKDTVAGAWKVEVSNKPNVESLGDTEAADITSGFETPAEVAIAAAAGSTLIQFVQTTYLKAGAVRITFTPTSGAGDVLAHMGA